MNNKSYHTELSVSQLPVGDAVDAGCYCKLDDGIAYAVHKRIRTVGYRIIDAICEAGLALRRRLAKDEEQKVPY